MKTPSFLSNKQLYFRILLLDLICTFALGGVFYLTIDWDILYILNFNFYVLLLLLLWGIFIFWRNDNFSIKQLLQAIIIYLAANIPFAFLATALKSV